MSTLTDLVTARALRFGLAATVHPDAAAELLRLARNDGRVLDRALARIHLAQADRPSQVGLLAAEALIAARALLAAEEGAVCASG